MTIERLAPAIIARAQGEPPVSPAPAPAPSFPPSPAEVPAVEPTQNWFDNWFMFFERLNKNASESALYLVDNYPWLALFVVLAVLYYGLAFFRELLQYLPQVLKSFFDGVRDIFVRMSNGLFASGTSFAAWYKTSFRLSMQGDFILVLFIATFALLGALANLSLILPPLTEMFGAGAVQTPFGRFTIAAAAAFIVIILELIVGIALYHAVRSVTDHQGGAANWRHYLSSPSVVVLLLLLLAFALFEAFLGLTREYLIEDTARSRQALEGGPSTAVDPLGLSTLPLVAQMLLGFLFPFVLAIVSTYIERLAYLMAAAVIFGLAWVTYAFGWLSNVLSEGLRLLILLIVTFIAWIEKLLSWIFLPIELGFKWVYRKLGGEA